MSSTADVVLTLGVAVIAAAAGVAGSVLGPLLGAKTAHRDWLRDKRAAQCEAYFAVLVEARDDAHHGRTQEALPGRLIPSDVTQDILNRFRDAASRLGLYVSRQLSDDAMGLWGEYQAVSLARLYPEQQERFDLFLERFDTLAEQLETSLRRELRVE